jgi:DNA-binding beta-propeller fold protein YncE
MTVSSKGVGYFQAQNGVIKFAYTGSIISVGGTPFSTIIGYGIAYDDATDLLYVTDPRDYIQPGDVYIINTNGATVRQFTGGIIPGAIAFKH